MHIASLVVFSVSFEGLNIIKTSSSFELMQNNMHTVYLPIVSPIWWRHRLEPVQVDRVVTPVWYVIGCLGNTLAAVVWMQRRMRTNNSSAVYLVALSIADLLFLLLHMIQVGIGPTDAAI